MGRLAEVASAKPLSRVADELARRFAKDAIQPRWAPAKLQRKSDRTSPPLGWPRSTDYLQFDGVSNETNAHRKVDNLFDVKQRALENLHAAGIDVVLVVTIVRGVNDREVGPIIQFAAARCVRQTAALTLARRGFVRPIAPGECDSATSTAGVVRVALTRDALTRRTDDTSH